MYSAIYCFLLSHLLFPFSTISFWYHWLSSISKSKLFRFFASTLLSHNFQSAWLSVRFPFVSPIVFTHIHSEVFWTLLPFRWVLHSKLFYSIQYYLFGELLRLVLVLHEHVVITKVFQNSYFFNSRAAVRVTKLSFCVYELISSLRLLHWDGNFSIFNSKQWVQLWEHLVLLSFWASRLSLSLSLSYKWAVPKLFSVTARVFSIQYGPFTTVIQAVDLVSSVILTFFKAFKFP